MTTSHDNPNNEDDDGTPPAGGEVGPGPQPPPATPTNVERHQVPGPHTDDGPLRQPRGRINPRNIAAATFITAAVVLIVVVAVHNSGGSKQPTVTVPTPTPTETVGQTGSTETPTTPTTPTTPAQPNYPPPKEPTYAAELEFSDGEGKVIDKEPVESATNEDFFTELVPEVNGNHHYFHVEGPLEGLGRVASWTGQGEPTFTGCKHALGTGGREVPFGQPGDWICAQTYKGSIALLRYDGSGAIERSYKFYAVVFPPHG